MMSERIAESVEEIDVLMQRYSDIGMLAISSDSVVSLRYDQAGNALKLIVQVGERIRYEETPRGKRGVMSKDICQRCGLREATITSEVGHFCSECDELNDVEQENVLMQEELARLKEENAQLRGLVQGYYTLLRVIQPGWEQIMAPHWDRQKDILQEQAKSFLKDVTQEGGER